MPNGAESVVIASGHTVTLSSDVTQDGPITLDGKLDTSGHVLTLGAAVTLRGAGEIVGTTRRVSPAAGSTLFFNNVSTTFNFTTAPGQMNVTLSQSAPPNATTTMLPRTYTLTPTGSANATVCLGYRDSELGTLIETDLRLCRWDTSASKWSCLTRSASSSTTNNIVCADNVTQFSDWALSASDPTAVTLASFRAAARRFDPVAWLTDIMRR